MLERIYELCRERGVTVKALEKELGLGNGTIRRWGSTNPSVKSVIAIARYFNVSMDWLTGLSCAKTRDSNFAFICDHLGLDEDNVVTLCRLKITPDWNIVLSNILEAVTTLTSK